MSVKRIAESLLLKIGFNVNNVVLGITCSTSE